MHLNYIQNILSIFDLYSWYVKILNLYPEYINYIFDHMGILDWKKNHFNFVWSMYKYTIFIKVWLNYSNEVILIWYNFGIKKALIIDKLLFSNNSLISKTMNYNFNHLIIF